MLICLLTVCTENSAQNLWQPTSGPLAWNVLSLVINPNGHIFAGTSSDGVFRSIDNGEHWIPVNAGLMNTHVWTLVINTNGHLFAGTAGSGIFRSTDNGDTWTPVNAGLAHPHVLSLVVNASGHIFAGTEGGGIFRSTDNGDTWMPGNQGLTEFFISALAVNKTNGNILAGTFLSGVFRSNDNGDTWVNTLLTNTIVPSLAINTSGHIFAGTYGSGIYRSSDGGSTWMSVNTGLTNNSIRSLAVSASGTVFVGTTDGVFCSNDNGNTWTPINTGLPNSLVLSFASHANGHVFAGTSENGVFRSIDSARPVITPTPVLPQLHNQRFAVKAKVTDDVKIANVTLSYRQGGEAKFDTVLMANTGDFYQDTIPANVVDSRGVEYFIMATDLFCNTTRRPPSGFFSVPILVTDETKSTAQPSGSDKIAYRLISVPLQLDDPSPVAVLEDDLGGYDRRKWRLFGLVNGQYIEFPNAGAFKPGNSLFLIVKEVNKFINVGSGQSIKTEVEFPIPLHNKHNFVASPFAFDIPLDKLRWASGVNDALQTYKGEWITATSFSPWQGYYLANNRSTFDTLFINPDLSAAGSLQPMIKKNNAGGWRVRILATCDEARDTENFAGVAPTSRDDWDNNDLVEPPPIGQYVSVYFHHPEWKKVLSRYRDDIRSPRTPNQRWNFTVESNILGDIVTLRFDGLPEIAEAPSVFLVDEELGYKQNLRENVTYQFRGRDSDKPKELALIVGEEMFIAEQTATLPGVPRDFVLSQNFPNPFNPATTIRYGLPKAERVTLKIYNLLGAEVATLVNDEQKVAGYHAAIWNGRDKNGRVVASGVYVYRIRAGSFSSTKKLALVK